MPESTGTEPGYLTVAVTTAQDSLPVEGAVVLVSDNADPPKLLHTAVTDRSGRTPQLALPAPPRSASLSPGNANPYALYTVQISHPRYRPQAAVQVPIFPAVESVLPVIFVPVTEVGLPDEAPLIRVLPPQTLNTT